MWPPQSTPPGLDYNAPLRSGYPPQYAPIKLAPIRPRSGDHVYKEAVPPAVNPKRWEDGSTPVPLDGSDAPAEPHPDGRHFEEDQFFLHSNIDPFTAPEQQKDYVEGCPAPSHTQWIIIEHLGKLPRKKAEKLLFSRSMFYAIQHVLEHPKEETMKTPAFRDWCRNNFELQELEGFSLVCNKGDTRPIAMRDQVHSLLCHAHMEAEHGGRDRTAAEMRRYYSSLPKEVISEFVKGCPTCQRKKTANCTMSLEELKKQYQNAHTPEQVVARLAEGKSVSLVEAKLYCYSTGFRPAEGYAANMRKDINGQDPEAEINSDMEGDLSGCDSDGENGHDKDDTEGKGKTRAKREKKAKEEDQDEEEGKDEEREIRPMPKRAWRPKAIKAARADKSRSGTPESGQRAVSAGPSILPTTGQSNLTHRQAAPVDPLLKGSAGQRKAEKHPADIQTGRSAPSLLAAEQAMWLAHNRQVNLPFASPAALARQTTASLPARPVLWKTAVSPHRPKVSSPLAMTHHQTPVASAARDSGNAITPAPQPVPLPHSVPTMSTQSNLPATALLAMQMQAGSTAMSRSTSEPSYHSHHINPSTYPGYDPVTATPVKPLFVTPGMPGSAFKSTSSMSVTSSAGDLMFSHKWGEAFSPWAAGSKVAGSWGGHGNDAMVGSREFGMLAPAMDLNDPEETGMEIDLATGTAVDLATGQVDG